jgi:hypothetical protein
VKKYGGEIFLLKSGCYILAKDIIHSKVEKGK